MISLPRGSRLEHCQIAGRALRCAIGPPGLPRNPTPVRRGPRRGRLPPTAMAFAPLTGESLMVEPPRQS